MSVHRIRLIGPWSFEWQPASEMVSASNLPGEIAGTVKMPSDWRSLFGEYAGCVAFSRRFHRPTNLDPHEQVWIVLTGVGGDARVSLNGEELAQFRDGEAAEVDVTSRLQRFNELSIQISYQPQDASRPGGLYEPVVLEIRG